MSASNPVNPRGQMIGRSLDVVLAIVIMLVLFWITSLLVTPKYHGFIALVGGVAGGFFGVHKPFLVATSKLKQRFGLPAESWGFQSRSGGQGA